MPRPAKPYIEGGWYVSRPAGIYLKLCPEQDGATKAQQLLREHLVGLDRERVQTGGRTLPRLTVAELFAQFLEAKQLERSAKTYEDYKLWLPKFAQHYGPNRPARDVTKAEALRFKRWLACEAYSVKRKTKGISAVCVNHAIVLLKAAFNWGARHDLLPDLTNPFRYVELMAAPGRLRVATPAEFQALIDACPDERFRDVLTMLRLSSARPGEVRAITWRMVDWDRGIIVIPEHKTSKTAKNPLPRVLGISPEVETVLHRRRERHGGGPDDCVFLNERGEPWTKNAIGLRWRRLRAKAGLKADAKGEQLVSYSTRHTFLSAAARDPSIPAAILAELAGHTTLEMTRRYIHSQAGDVGAAARSVAPRLKF